MNTRRFLTPTVHEYFGMVSHNLKTIDIANLYVLSSISSGLNEPIWHRTDES